MAKKLDLSGKRYGRLDVLEEFGISRNNKTLWKCLCDCGNEIIVIGSSLISGNTKSCGCLHLEQSSINGKNNALKQLDDISGNTYGKIVVKEFSHTKNGKTYWLCLCDCGKEFITRADSIKNGHTKSCGCLTENPIMGGWNILELVGKTFGELTVISFDSVKNNKSYWKCMCSCGNEVFVSGGNLNSGMSKSCGCSTESYIAKGLKSYLIEKYNSKSEHKLFKNPKTNQWLRCDIYLPSENVYIEVHGEQHYKLNSWHKLQAKRSNTTPEEEFEYQQWKDKEKKKFCKKNGTYIEVNLMKIKTVEKAIQYVENKLLK